MTECAIWVGLENPKEVEELQLFALQLLEEGLEGEIPPGSVYQQE